MNGHLHWYRVGSVSLNVCNAARIDDNDWRAYLEGVLELGKGEPVASVTHFMGVLPNSVQRKITADFVRLHRLPRISIAFLTDSAVARGTITAFGWILPSARTRAFKPSELAAGLDWLATITPLDRREIERCMHEAWSALRAQQASA